MFAELSGGVRYGVAGKDLSAVTELLKLADEAEIERRWRAALTAPPGWYRSDSIAAFLSKWNSYASGAAPRDLKRGRVGAEDIPPEAFKEVGRVENF